MKVPEADLLKHDPDLDEINNITVIVEDDKAHLQKGGPLVALHFKRLKQKLKLSDIKNAFAVNEMLSKADKAEIQRKKTSTSIKDIRERAQKYNNARNPADKIFLTHIQ